MYYDVTREGDEKDPDRDAGPEDSEDSRQARRGGREEAPKERVLHTRVPAVLEQELKRLAQSLRVPVSNVVRAILEDALDAVDTVGERAEGGILGFAERLARQRDELHRRVRGEADEAAPEPAVASEPPVECPAERSPLLDGVYAYQPLILANEGACTVCGRRLPAGTPAHRALFDDPTKKVFLGPSCRLLPEKGEPT
jgi:hypothetical protein